MVTLPRNVPPLYSLSADYPKTLHLLSHGALFSLNGDKKLGVMSRGVAKAHVEIARLLPNQLHHLVSQNSGTIVQPRKCQNPSLMKLVEREQIDMPLPDQHEGKTVYDHIDLAPYLNSNGGRKGIFVIRLTDAADEINRTFDGYYRKLLTAVTATMKATKAKQRLQQRQQLQRPEHHLGSAFYCGDGSWLDRQEITRRFAGCVCAIHQHWRTGGRCHCEVLGKNGLQVQTGITDASGRVTFAKLGELKREKAPLMYVVSQGNDSGFFAHQCTTPTTEFFAF